MDSRNSHTDRAWIEIRTDRLAHNVRVLQNAMPPRCQLMAVVKTAAYGHGAVEVSSCLAQCGVRAFAVATIDEGIQLREHGIDGTILIFGYTDVRRAKELQRFDLTQTVIDFTYAKALAAQELPLRVHIKIDTGMHRLGLPYDRPDEIEAVFAMPQLRAEGIYTHLCCCDSLHPEDVAFTREQIRRFALVLDRLRAKNIPVPKQHIQSSYGLLNYPELECDYVRAGIALYGVRSAPGETKLQLDLRQVLSLKTRVAAIRQVPKGEFVGYGRAFQTTRDSRLAILPVGYGDGFPRNLSCGKASVQIGAHILPIVGRICMDQLTVDITDAADVAIGDVASLLGDAAPILAPEVAAHAGSISNELLSRMGARLPVVVKH